jgi:hypothetical protein
MRKRFALTSTHSPKLFSLGSKRLYTQLIYVNHSGSLTHTPRKVGSAAGGGHNILK